MDNLAESVASVAETFIHEELTPNEEATLRESMHPDHGVSQSSVFEDNVPGGLDPFISEEEVHFNEADPPGVSIFATLIERLLARFQFEATDTRITIVNPQHASFTLIVPDIRYETVSHESAGRTADSSTPASSDARSVGETRKVTISGVTVTTRCLRPMSPQPWSAPVAVPTPKSPTASPPLSVREVPETSPRTPTLQPTPDVISPLASPSVSPIPMAPSLASTPEPSSPGLFPQDESAPLIQREPSSPYSDSSDLDEDTQLFMSQSIAVLPPRPVSPASSVASSMYQSAISATEPDTVLDDIPEEDSTHSRSPTPAELSEPVHVSPPQSPQDMRSEALDSPIRPPVIDAIPPGPQTPPISPSQRRLTVRILEIEDETILSLGSEPIELRLTTPPPFRPTPTPPAPRPAPSSADQPGRVKAESGSSRQDKVRIELTMGIIACALSGWQIRSIIDVADMWTSHSAPPAPVAAPVQSNDSNSPIPLDDVEGNVRIRGLVVLLLPTTRTSASNPDDALTEYFSRPLVPPQLPRGYTRIHIEGLSTYLTMKRSMDPPKGSKRLSSRREPPSVSATFTISELSAFSFVPSTGPNAEMTASPILITDQNLPVQYHVPHVHPSLAPTSEPSSSLPTFEVSDWTDPTQRSVTAKLSLWRTKAAQQSARPQSQTGPDDHRYSSPGPVSPPRRGMDLPKMSSSPSGRPIPVALPSSPGRLGLAGLSSSPGKGVQAPSKPQPPALSVKFRSARPKEGRDVPEVHVALAPLHIFVDTGMILGRKEDGKSEVLQFLDDLTASPVADKAEASDEPHPEENPYDDEDDEEYRPSTPRGPTLRGFPDRETDQERERRRLEQLVLEDLDLGYDYRGQGPSRAPPTPTSRRSAVGDSAMSHKHVADSGW